MENGRILGIAYNVIPVKDMEVSAAWFVNILDLTFATNAKDI